VSHVAATTVSASIPAIGSTPAHLREIVDRDILPPLFIAQRRRLGGLRLFLRSYSYLCRQFISLDCPVQQALPLENLSEGNNTGTLLTH